MTDLKQARVPPDREALAESLTHYSYGAENKAKRLPEGSERDWLLGLRDELREAASALRIPTQAEVEAACSALEDGGLVLEGPARRKIAALLRRLSSPVEEWRPTHRHYKGGLYRVVARGKIEADLSPVVIYDNKQGETWVRPVRDFEEYLMSPDSDRSMFRRFDSLPPAPPQEKPT